MGDMTRLRYMEEMQRVDADARVAGVLTENDRAIVVLDETIFYPQGGGQPFDKGIIESDSARFRVDETRFADGVVRHIGAFERGEFQEGEAVRLEVDRGRRALMSRLHSAGHVVDMAVNAIGRDWIPGKGYHFPEGPYVEYAGALGESERDGLKAEIERRANELVSRAIETSIRFLDRDEMKNVCHFVPDYVPEGKPSRVVFYGTFGVPCGGTHVANLGAIGVIVIRKLKPSGGTVRVSYDIAR